MNSAIPQTLQEDIQQFVQSLANALGDDLVSVVMYGGMAKSKSIKETDTIKLMVVIREITTDILDRIADPYMKHKRFNQIQLLTLSEEDLQTSTDVFPIKFLDMQQDYEVLAGQDVVKGLKISRDNLRIRCEQELKNLMLRLRQTYINHSSKPKVLSSTMTKSYFAFLNGLDVLAELSTGNTYRQADEILDAGEKIGLNMAPLRRVKKLRDGQIFDSTDEQKTVYEELMATVRNAASMADKLES